MTTASPKIDQAATQTGAVDLSETLLLGLINAPEGPRALLRYASGRVKTVAPGDRTRAGKVLAIGEDRVVLAGRNGAQVILTMPGG